MAKQETTQEDFQKVIGGASLSSINLSAFQCRCLSQLPKDYSLVLETVTERYDFPGIFCSVTLKLSCEDEGTEGKEIAAFEGTYNLVYTLAESDYSDSAIELFVERNGTYNVYPYFRELVDSHARRMGLGIITLPLLKPQNAGAKTIRFTRQEVKEVGA